MNLRKHKINIEKFNRLQKRLNIAFGDGAIDLYDYTVNQYDVNGNICFIHVNAIKLGKATKCLQLLLTHNDNGFVGIDFMRNVSFSKEVEKPEVTVFTYVMTDASGLYKIGKTNNISRRLKQGRTQNPTLELVCVIDKDVESKLHYCFSHRKQQIRGATEWYALQDNDVNFIKNTKW